MRLPSFGVAGGERFGSEDRLAVDVRGRGHFGATVGAVVAPRPELGHRLVRLAAIFEFVTRRAIGFDRKFQPMSMGEFTKAACVITDDQIRNGLPQVPEKSFGDLRAVDSTTGNDRQIFPEIVTAQTLKIFTK